MITVVGLGGVGKTRVARELMVARGAGISRAARSSSTCRRCADHRLVAAAVAAAAGVRRSGRTVEGDEIDQLALVLQAEPALLVLDNAEHVTDVVGRLVARLVVRAPESRFVVTSRVPLDLEGERVVRLGPLPVPAEDSSAGRDRVVAFGADAGAADR